MKNKSLNRNWSGCIVGILVIFLLMLCCWTTQIPQMIDYAINAPNYISATNTAWALTPEALRPTATVPPTPPTQEPTFPTWGDTYLNFPEGTQDVIVVYSGSPSSGYNWSDSNYTIITATYYCLIGGRYRECVPTISNVSDED